MIRVGLQGLSKIYTGAEAASVRGLTLDMAAGELTALLGPSGCGKTTTMKMIAGLLAPTSGDITFDGRSVLRETPEARGAVMVFQNSLLFPFLSVAENVGFGLKMRGLPRPEIARRVDEMLDRVRLPGLGHRRPQDLSGGQQQRVALARALIVRPRVLLLDEPLSNLDAHLRLEMRDLIRALHRDAGLTTVLVTHDQEEAVVLADRIALMLDGRARQFAPPETFYTRPADRTVAQFFGGQNFLPGRVEGGVFLCPQGRFVLPAGLDDGPGTLTIRPERLRPALPGDPNSLTARVGSKLYLGTQTRLRLSLGGADLDMLCPPAEAARLTEGDEISVTLPRDDLWVLRD